MTVGGPVAPRTGRLGVAMVGLGGAVATTAVAGVELLRQALVGLDGLPLAALDADLAPYDALVFGGWDLTGDDLAKAAEVHGVLEAPQLAAVADHLAQHRPWPGVGSADFCRNVEGDHRVEVGHRAAVQALVADLERFRNEQSLDGIVVVNLASTERVHDTTLPVFDTIEAFEAGLDCDHPEIGPGSRYAYAAIQAGGGYANFTPSVAADVPALEALAQQRGVPLAGKDGKTGQTMLKTVLAPALRSRALTVEGWFSTNLLGNRDGRALEDPDSLAAKLATKRDLLNGLLGYPVDDHVVTINYYRPRGDAKEAWDAIDLVGFLGQRMQLKINFLCRDSVLAAPLVLELARTLDLARRRGEGGVVRALGWFFKAPVGPPPIEHALHRQEAALLDWLAAGR